MDSDVVHRHANAVAELHRLKVPALLRKTLHSTNPIESMFSMVRDGEGNIKRYRTSKMRQRWLGAVLLHCERRFKRVKGYTSIKAVVAAIDASHEEKAEEVKAALSDTTKERSSHSC